MSDDSISSTGGSPLPGRIPAASAPVDYLSSPEGTPVRRPIPKPAPAAAARLPTTEYYRLPATDSPVLQLFPDVSFEGIHAAVVKLATQKRGYGLFRRLSVVASVEMEAETPITVELQREVSRVTNDLEASLFGLKRSPSWFDSPGYDELGRFPMFIDQQGREYFSSEEAFTFHVRLPRKITANVSKKMYTIDEVPEFDLPEVGGIVSLKTTKPLVLPIYYDVYSRSVASIRHSDALMSEATTTLAEAIQEHDTFVNLLVIECSQRTSAVGRLVTSPLQSSLSLQILSNAQSRRYAYSFRVTELITTMLRDAVPQERVLSVCEYLQHVWSPVNQ